MSKPESFRFKVGLPYGFVALASARIRSKGLERHINQSFSFTLAFRQDPITGRRPLQELDQQESAKQWDIDTDYMCSHHHDAQAMSISTSQSPFFVYLDSTHVATITLTLINLFGSAK